MSAAKFIGLTCLVFLLVGPLVPFPVVAMSAAILTGDIGKLNDMFSLSWISYLFGWPIALRCGFLFGVCAWFLARFVPAVVPIKHASRRTLFGVLLGVLVSFSYIVPAFISRLTRMRMNPPFSEDFALSLLVWWRSDALSSFTIFLLPSAVCGALATTWLLPKFLDNLSVKQDAPQAACALP